MHSHRIHAIYWAPAGVSFPPGYTQQIDAFLTAVSQASGRSDNVYSTAAQYGDTGGAGTYRATYAGAILDAQPYPRQVCTDPSTRRCMTDGQVRAEIDRVIAAKRLVRGMADFYVVLTPSDVGNCADSGSKTCAYRDYCGFHSFYGSGRARTIYALLPYSDVSACRPASAGPHVGHADPTIDALSHEHIEAITDPLGDAWTDSAGDEIADKCETSYGRTLGNTPFGPFNQSIAGGVYRLQSEWSNSARACVLRR